MRMQIVIACCLWVLPFTNALAQGRVEKTPGALVAADQYFREGAFDKALIEYQKAFETDYNPAIYYNIAQCLHRLEHYEKAILYYELFISKNMASPLIPHVREHIAQCQAKLQEIRKLQEAQSREVVGPRKVAVVSDPPGAEVFVDAFSGEPAGITPLMLELDGKSHLLVLRKAGYRDVSQMVDAKTPGMALLQFVLEPVTKTAALPAADPKTSARTQASAGVVPPAAAAADCPPQLTQQWWFWTGLAATSVFAVSAIVTGLRTLDLQSQWEDTGDDSVRRRGERYRTWTDALAFGMLVSGGVTVAAALLWNPRASVQPRPQSAFHVTPVAGMDQVGVLFTFPF